MSRPLAETCESQLAAYLAVLEARLAAVEIRLSALDGCRPPPNPVKPALHEASWAEDAEEKAVSRMEEDERDSKARRKEEKEDQRSREEKEEEPKVEEQKSEQKSEQQEAKLVSKQTTRPPTPEEECRFWETPATLEGLECALERPWGALEALGSDIRRNWSTVEHNGEAEVDEDPSLLDYQLGSTLWDAPAVLGLRELGGYEVSLILLTSTLLNAAAQVYLVGVLLGSESFVMRDKWSGLLESTIRWRDNEAHQWNQVDASGTSLAARVCGLDDALSTASEQSGVLNEINAYNGLVGRELVPTTFSTGPWLCIVCLFLWAAVIARELRDMCTSTLALMKLPRGKVTKLHKGKLVCLSQVRRIAIVVMTMVRGFVALALLWAGLLWLAHTSSTTDLILNAAALTFVMDTDELLLETTVPSVVHRFMEDLKPVQYKSPLFYIEAIVPTTFILVTVVTCVTTLVLPNVGAMLAVKKEMCGGTVDFAVSQSGAGFAVAKQTNPFPSDDHWGIKERAVQQLRHHAEDGLKLHSDYAFVAQNSDIFNSFKATSVEDFARMGVCADKDTLKKGQRIKDKPFWFTAVSQATGAVTDGPWEPQRWRCADYSAHCDNSTMVRSICPVTCGCDDPISGQIYSHPQLGVPQACIEKASDFHRGRECVDMQVANSPNWRRWWLAYKAAILLKFPKLKGNADYANFIQRKIAGGCSDTALDPVHGADFCEETSPALHANRIGSVKAFCPATCCKLDPSKPGCPPSCGIRV